MNTLSKTTAILFSGILFFLATVLPIQLHAQDRQAVSDDATETIKQDDPRSQQVPRRGIFQPRESRLVYQVDGLTEDQKVRIDELNEIHRNQVADLLERWRADEMTREAFLAQRRANFDRHQEQLKEVLTKAQWEQLRELRAERRRTAPNE